MDERTEQVRRRYDRASGGYDRGEPLQRSVIGDARDLAFGDGAFDTVLCAMAQSTIPGQRRALAEMRRVLRPGGLLLLIDHIEYTRWPFRGREARKERPRRLPRAVAAEVGFEVGEHGRIALGFVEYVVARRTG